MGSCGSSQDTGPAGSDPDAAGPEFRLTRFAPNPILVAGRRKAESPGEVVGTSYCDIAPGHEWHGPYHDREYGFPLRGDAELFERLILEINQAGLSWLTILKKRDAFRRAYHGFDPELVAHYGKADHKRLLADVGIIRNRLKVDAAIANAQRILEMRKTHGSFAGRPAAHHPTPQ